MKHVDGRPNLTGFGFWDVQTDLERKVASFIELVLKQCPPSVDMPYGFTCGDPIGDAQNSHGFRPENPLTVRLYIECFSPNDGSSIQYEDSIDSMINRVIKENPAKETLEVIKNALSKEVEKLEKAIENWVDKPFYYVEGEDDV